MINIGGFLTIDKSSVILVTKICVYQRIISVDNF